MTILFFLLRGDWQKEGNRLRRNVGSVDAPNSFGESQVVVAQLMYQFSPLQMITRQQTIILDTFASAFNGALEGHDNADSDASPRPVVR